MKYTFIVLATLILCACGGSTTDKKDCSIPPPVAIFTKEIDEVTKHSFQVEGQMAKEEISFANSTSLEIYQSGCDRIIQEFIFDVPNELITSKIHTQQAIQQLRFISKLDNKFLAFDQWAQAIEYHEPAFFESDEVEVSPGFNVRLDRLKATKSHKIIIRMSQS